MADLVELTGTIKYLFKNCPKPDGWFGCFFKTASREFKLTGRVLFPVKNGDAISVIGSFSDDDSFAASCVFRVMTNDQLIDYLASDLFPGIGKKVATKVVDAFGEMTLSVIAEQPHKLSALGLSSKQRQVLIKGVNERNIKYQLLKHFPMLSEKMCTEIAVTFNKEAMSVIQSDPYRLCYECDSVPFSVAHKIAVALSFNHEKQIEACLTQAILNVLSERGDICASLSDSQSNGRFIYEAERLLSDGTPRDQIIFIFQNRLFELPRLVVDDVNGAFFVYSYDSYHAETQAVTSIKRLLNKQPLQKTSSKDIIALIDDYERKSGFSLDGQQRLAVVTAIKKRISVITGGPGRGKTTIIGCLVYCWKRIGGNKLFLSAPTGLAARRLTQVVNQPDLKAQTIAKQIIGAKIAKDGSFFAPFKQALIIVDECSMIGLSDAAAMLRLYEDAQVVLVGDFDQLPSISAGQFFKDVCISDVVPTTQLMVCYRASDGRQLIENADKINKSAVLSDLEFDDTHFKLTPFIHDDVDYQNYLINQYVYYMNKGFKHEDIVLLCATKKGLTGVDTLNRLLQDVINPHDPLASCSDKGYAAVGFSYFYNKQPFSYRVGDRIMQTKNHADLLYDLYDIDKNIFIESGCGIFNGDCGTILSVDQEIINGDVFSKLCVQMDDGRRFDIDGSMVSELTLAYAMTIHKSQGCEYPVVIISNPVSLTSSSWAVDCNFLTRNLLYTAITRSRQFVELVGDVNTIDACLTHAARNRVSWFVEKLKS